MSVIINMLKDLEQRQQPNADKPAGQAAGEFVRPQLQYQSTAKSRSPWVSVIVVAVLLIPTLWFGVAMYRQANTQIISEPDAISASASKETGSLAVSQAQDNDSVSNESVSNDSISNDSVDNEQPTLALSPAPTPIPVATPAITAAITQDSVQTTDNIAKLDISAADTASVANAAAMESAPQTSKVPETVNTPKLLTATVVTDNPSVSGSNNLASNKMASNKISSNNIASNKIEPAQGLTTALSSDSTAQAAMVKLAMVKPALVKSKAVAMTVKEVVLSKAQMAQLQYHKALDAEAAQRLEDAAGYYLEAIMLQPSLHQARKQLVDIYYSQNDPTTAMQLLDSGISLFPQQWEFYVMLARMQTTLTAYDAALATVAMIPDNSSWARDKWIVQTELAQESQNRPLAEAAYRHLVVAESSKPRWWMGLAYALDLQGKYPQAAKAYRSALSYQGLSTSAMTFIETRLAQLGEHR